MSEPDASPSPRLDGFGFDSGSEEWLQRLRDAERQRVLGTIGPYELIAEISRGGQGVVYRARQPGTHREIALKRLLAGAFATSEARRRFEREIEAAAALDHENVVRIYGVEVVDGEPILAMQWIEGLPVNEWARPAGVARATREILDAFLAICAGVGHAHQNGVIHRDLKPSNILVDAHGKPHVLDFGLAKRLVGTDEPALTTIVGFAGTPAYASPEQVSPQRGSVDVRSDVYSLAVILFELLSGQLPFSAERGMHELLRAIEQDEPKRLSHSERGIHRELDTIVDKALSKEKERRYASVDAMAEDVRRHLRGDPIVAHPPSSLYQFRKFACRRWLPLSAASAIFGLLGALAVTQTLAVQRITLARDRADHEAANSRSVLDYLGQKFLAAADPLRLGPNVSLRQTLDLARQQVDQSFEGKPDVKAEILTVLGNSYAAMGEIQLGEELLREADRIQVELKNVDPVQRIETLQALAEVLESRGRHAEVESLVQRAIALAPGHATKATDVSPWLGKLHAQALLGEARFAEARIAAADLCAEVSPASAEDHSAAEYQRLLGSILHASGDVKGARTQFELAVETERAFDPQKNAWLASALAGLGASQVDSGEFDAALASYSEALAIRKARFGERHFLTAETLVGMVQPLVALDRLDEARGHMDRAAEILQAAFVERDPTAAMTAVDLASVLLHARSFELADQLSERALDVLVQSRGEANPEVITALVVRAHARRGMGAIEEAREFLRRAVELCREQWGSSHPRVAETLNELGLVLTSSRDFAGARKAFLESGDILRRQFGDQHPRLCTVDYNLARAIDAEGESLNDPKFFSEAAEHFRAALDAARKCYAPGHAEQLDAFVGYMGDLVFTRRAGDGEALCVEMLTEWRAKLGESDARAATLEGWLGVIYRDTKRFDRAEQSLLDAIAKLEAAVGRESVEAQEFRGALFANYVRGASLEKADACWITLAPETRERFQLVHAELDAARAGQNAPRAER